MAGGRIEARDPRGTTLEPPVVPQGAVFVGGVGEGDRPALVGHAVAIRVGARELALTARTVFGPATRDGDPEVTYRLFDPDQRAVVKVGEPVAFGICGPDGTAHVPEDYALFELPPAEATAPLPVVAEKPKVGDPLWVAAHGEEGLELTLVEVAEVGPQELMLYMSKDSVAGWAGAPCLNAKGEVVATISRVLEGQDALVVQAMPIQQALAALER
jgi:trypsin-like peptidase